MNPVIQLKQINSGVKLQLSINLIELYSEQKSIQILHELLFFIVLYNSENTKKNNQNLPGMGGIFNHINSNLYHYAGNNPVRYIDPDGEDIKESELSSFSLGVGISARISLGIAKDSNHRTSIYMKLETGLGVGGSIANADTCMESLDTTIGIFQDISNNFNAVKTIDNAVPNTGKKNFEENITHHKETVSTWLQEGKTTPVEAAIIVGVSGDKNGEIDFSLGATAIANVYLREDTWYFDITSVINSIKSFANKVKDQIIGE